MILFHLGNTLIELVLLGGHLSRQFIVGFVELLILGLEVHNLVGESQIDFSVTFFLK